MSVYLTHVVTCQFTLCMCAPSLHDTDEPGLACPASVVARELSNELQSPAERVCDIDIDIDICIFSNSSTAKPLLSPFLRHAHHRRTSCQLLHTLTRRLV
jgi:hypothetical protein